MYPILCKIGPFTLYSYGVGFAMAYATGTFIAARRAKKSGYDPGDVIDLSVVMFVSGLVIARLMTLFENPGYYLAHPLKIFNVFEGGLVFYGALIGSVGSVFVFSHLKKLSGWRMLDFIAPGILFGHMWGRLGCFFGGCCYGVETDMWSGVVFGGGAGDVSRHPAQLYESIGNFVCFILLLHIEKRYKRFQGFTFCVYLILYGILRFMIEFVRGDERGAFLFGALSISQCISLVGITCALIIILVTLTRKNTLSRRKKAKEVSSDVVQSGSRRSKRNSTDI